VLQCGRAAACAAAGAPPPLAAPPPPSPSLPLLPSLSSSPPRPPSLSPPPTASPSLPLKAPSRTTTRRTRVRTSGSRETCSRLAASRSLLCAWCASPPLATAPAQRGRAGAASGGASGGRARLGREGGAEPAGMDVRGQGGVAGGRAWLGADPLSCRLRRPGRCARFPAAACVARRLCPLSRYERSARGAFVDHIAAIAHRARRSRFVGGGSVHH